jgi:cytoskeletal protein CcmA (bactofilin family)
MSNDSADNCRTFSIWEVDVWNREASPEDAGHQPVSATSPAISAEAAWIGKSVFLRGDLVGLEDLTIEGRVEGTIELRDHTLTIGREANIQADIVAKTVAIFGVVKGGIIASETIHIAETGVVQGDISSRRLAIADGALFQGQIDTVTGAALQPIRKSPAAPVP